MLSLNQGKLDMFKKEIARMDIDILGICEAKLIQLCKV